MKFDISFERTFPHPRDKVWRALTDRAALGQWLMETDFDPVAGHDFDMWCDDGAGGTDRYRCRVLEIEPPTRMFWSWVLEGNDVHGETRVEFRLDEVPGGTRLTVRHIGDRDAGTVANFRRGWPLKLEQLAEVVDAGETI